MENPKYPGIPGTEYHSVTYWLFGFSLAFSSLRTLYVFIASLMVSPVEAIIEFVLSLISLVVFYYIIVQKRWALITWGVLILLNIIMSPFAYETKGEMVSSITQSVMGAILVSLLLCLKKYGVSGWRVIWNNGQPINLESSDKYKEEPSAPKGTDYSEK